MSDSGDGDNFEPITSQEDFEKRLGSRLQRERAKFADYDDLRAKAEQVDVLTAQLAEKSAAADSAPEWQQQIAELQSRLDAADAARAAAEQAAAEAALAQLRTDRAAEKGLPAPLARKLISTTAEEIDVEIDELLPLLQSGPRPNPQQGNPSQARGGSMSAGRERYAAKSN